jgi:hypothetical protein
LPDPCHQGSAAGLDALGLVQRHQGLKALRDLRLRYTLVNKLFEFKVVQNCIKLV